MKPNKNSPTKNGQRLFPYCCNVNPINIEYICHVISVCNLVKFGLIIIKDIFYLIAFSGLYVRCLSGKRVLN